MGVSVHLDKCSSPVLSIDGTIYIGSADSNLYAFTADGNVISRLASERQCDDWFHKDICDGAIRPVDLYTPPPP